MQRLSPGLVAHAILAAINLVRPSSTETILDLDAYRARLPQARVHIADRARRSFAEQRAHRAWCASRRPGGPGDLRRLQLAVRKRELRAARRLDQVLAGGWGVIAQADALAHGAAA